MKQLHELLKNPFGGLTKGNENEFQQECARIAEELFSGYCIKCNDKEYYFADKLAYFDLSIPMEDWNKARPSYYTYKFKYDNH